MSNKKWVLFVNSNAYPCNIGGIEIFNSYLLKELSKEYNIHQYTYCKVIKSDDKIVKHIYKKPKFLLKLLGPLQVFFFLMKNKKRIKLVHFSYARSYWIQWFIYAIIKNVLGIEYMITIHGGGLSAWKPEFSHKLFFKNAKIITGVSEKIIKEYSKRSNRKIIFTPPLIPFDVILPKNKYREKWLVDPDDKVILYVGSLKPLKSVDTLIEALGIITKNKLIDYNLKVLIVGDGISRKDLEDRVVELNLQDVVSFLGNIERGNINQLYNLADIYTICSEFEGLPISLLEAFVNNLPCISSDASGLKEVSLNNKNTLLFKTKDPKDLALKIELLLNDELIEKRLIKNSNLYFENNFSYASLVDEFKNIFDQIEFKSK